MFGSVGKKTYLRSEKRFKMKTKGFIMAAMLLMTAFTASAQKEVGSFTIQPKVGMTVSTMTNDPQMGAVVLSGVGTIEDNISNGGNLDMSVVEFKGIKEKIGLVAGAEAEYQVTKRLSLSAGLLYSMQGAKYDDCNVGNINVTNAKVMLEYINIPIMANFYVVKGLALRAGLQPAFCVKDEVKCDVTAHVKEGWTVYKKGVAMPDFKTFDFSVPVGVSYEYHDFVIGAMYNIGLTNIFDGNWDGGNDGPSAHNSVFQITLGYKIGL